MKFFLQVNYEVVVFFKQIMKLLKSIVLLIFLLMSLTRHVILKTILEKLNMQ